VAIPLGEHNTQTGCIPTVSCTCRAPSKRSSRTTWLLVGLTGVVGLHTGLVLKSHRDKEFIQWVNNYIPGWAWYVDKYGSPFIEWTKQTLFQRGKEPLSSNKQELTIPPPVQETRDVKLSKATEDPVADTSSKVSQLSPTENKDTATSADDKHAIVKLSNSTEVAKDDASSSISQPSPGDTTTTDDDKHVTAIEVKEDSKPLDINKADKFSKEKSEGSTESDKPLESTSEESESQAEIKTNLVDCLKEFTAACGDVVGFNLLLAESMEKARCNLAKELLLKSQDDKALSEMKKSHEEEVASLKAKVEDGYCNYCVAHQKLLAVISEATNADLTSQVLEAKYKIFDLSSSIQASEDTVKRNKTINDAFDSFRNTMKSTEIKIDQELAELNKSSFIDPSVVETVVLRLAETMVTLLNDKLQKLSVDSGKNLEESLHQYREELFKTFEARILKATEDSRAEMQAKTEEKVGLCCYSEFFTCLLYLA